VPGCRARFRRRGCSVQCVWTKAWWWPVGAVRWQAMQQDSRAIPAWAGTAGLGRLPRRPRASRPLNCRTRIAAWWRSPGVLQMRPTRRRCWTNLAAGLSAQEKQQLGGDAPADCRPGHRCAADRALTCSS
jgi:hypothetical protein